jgi:hypothetical protein
MGRRVIIALKIWLEIRLPELEAGRLYYDRFSDPWVAVDCLQAT